MGDCRENMKSVDGYVKALEAELVKIQVFQRELPLCFELVSKAIAGCKQKLKCDGIIDYFHEEQQNQQQQHSDCSDQTSSDGVPVLEQFIPIKRVFSDDEEESNKSDIKRNKFENSGTKSDWLRSAQLWNQSPDPTRKKIIFQEQLVAVKKNSGAFKPFVKENDVIRPTPLSNKSLAAAAVSTAATSSSAEKVSDDSRNVVNDRYELGRKQRRCWSPELHRRFLNALEHLGGAHVATPKQIREFMKVDGLTNDEVKSHLQKFRLHTTRRPSSSSGTPNNNNQQNPQCIVLGGVWVQPQQEYASLKTEEQELEGKHSLSEEIGTNHHSLSQASSSSTATDASPRT